VAAMGGAASVARLRRVEMPLGVERIVLGLSAVLWPKRTRGPTHEVKTPPVCGTFARSAPVSETGGCGFESCLPCYAMSALARGNPRS
jgi:hypothetical protein